MSDGVSAADVKALRERTGRRRSWTARRRWPRPAATSTRRSRSCGSRARRRPRSAAAAPPSEGVVASYIHADRQGGRAGRGAVRDRLRRPQRGLPGVRARGRASHRGRSLAAPLRLRRGDPEEDREAERKVFEAKAREEGKPDDIVEKIVEGQLAKWAKEVALLEQEHVRADRYEGKTIEELRAELAAKTGENVRDRALRPLRGRRGLTYPQLPRQRLPVRKQAAPVRTAMRCAGGRGSRRHAW